MSFDSKAFSSESLDAGIQALSNQVKVEPQERAEAEEELKDAVRKNTSSHLG